MKNLKFILIFVWPLITKAQQQKEPNNYSTYVKIFIQNFNLENYSQIVKSASISFLTSVPENKFIDFIKGIRNDFGKIDKSRFKYFDSKGSAVYHMELENTWFNFIVGLNDSDKLKRFVVLDPNYNEELPVTKNKTKMTLPFDTTWYVFWGGDSEKENYHVTVKSQKNAFDFLIRDSTGKSYKIDGKNNEDYYSFGKNIYSPCDGVVVKVIDGVKQNIPGEMNPDQLTGNTIIIRSNKNEYILMAHFQANSIIVKEGDKVNTGQFLAKCGNSGNSSEPHLHLHIMDASTLKDGVGIKCYFNSIIVNGKLKKLYSPVRGEKVSK